MKKSFLIIGLALLASLASAASPCPLQYEIGSLVSGTSQWIQLVS